MGDGDGRAGIEDLGEEGGAGCETILKWAQY